MRDHWNRFFHDTQRPDALAGVRIGLCFTLLVGVLQRVPHARELISRDGAAAPMFDALDGWVPPGTIAVALYAALAVCLLAGLIGWQTRVALLAATGLYASVGLLDGATTMTKYTVIGTHGLLLLAMSPSAAAWSVDARFGGAARRLIPLWPTRLLVLFLCAMYFGTAVTKVVTPAYHTGEHLMFWMLTDINVPHPLGHWLSTKPTLAVIASELALLWELLFPVLVWRPAVRPWLLAIGAAFHLGTFTLLGLWLFPFIVLAFYPACLHPCTVRRALVRLQATARDLLPERASWQPLRPLLTGPGFAGVLAFTLVTAVEAEHHFDPTDARHPDRRPAAVPLSAEEASQLLAPTASPTPADWIYRVDLGTTYAAGAVLPSTKPLKVGQQPLVQVWLHQPHPDFWLQTDLHRIEENGHDRLLYEGGQAITRGERSTAIPMNDSTVMTPGEYALVLKYGGRELWRRPFRMVE